jgi:transcriptional regulator with XRE-family HTH domain
MSGDCPAPAATRPNGKISITCERVTARPRTPNLSLMGEWDHQPFVAYLDAAMSTARIRSDAELARLSGIGQQQLSTWRRGVRPSTRLLDKLAPALRVPARDLYRLGGWLPANDRTSPAPAVLPQEIRDLIDFYNAPGRTDEQRALIRAHVSVAVSGLGRLFAETDSRSAPTRARRAG